jgi:hypothetical protein
MIDRCSMTILNVQAGIDVIETSAAADMVEVTKIFEREIGEEEIVCRISYRGGDLKPSKCSPSRSSGPSTSFQNIPRKLIVSVTILNPFGMLRLSLDNVKSFPQQN